MNLVFIGGVFSLFYRFREKGKVVISSLLMYDYTCNNPDMATIIKDTHSLIQMLQSGGFTAEQAETFKLVFDSIDLSELVTKDDIKDLRIEFYKITTAQTLIIIGAMVALAQAL